MVEGTRKGRRKGLVKSCQAGFPEAKIHHLEPHTGITRKPERLRFRREYSSESLSQGLQQNG
jgi:hypothetical protein